MKNNKIQELLKDIISLVEYLDKSILNCQIFIHKNSIENFKEQYINNILKTVKKIIREYQYGEEFAITESLEYYTKPLIEEFSELVCLNNEEINYDIFSRLQLNNLFSDYILISKFGVEELGSVGFYLDDESFSLEHIKEKQIKHLKKVTGKGYIPNSDIYQLIRENMATSQNIFNELRELEANNEIEVNVSALEIIYSLANREGHLNLRLKHKIFIDEEFEKFFLIQIFNILEYIRIEILEYPNRVYYEMNFGTVISNHF